MVQVYSKAVPDVKRLEFSPVTANKRGSNSVYVSYNQSRVSLQGVEVTGKVYSAPFGISSFSDDDPNVVRKNLDLSIHCPEALAFWQAVDEVIIQAAIDNAATWFRVALTPAQIRKNYSPLVIVDDSGKGYLPRLHTKVTVANQEAGSSLRVFNYDTCKNTVSMASISDVHARSKGVPIIDMGSIFFMGASKFGLTLYTTDFLLFPDRTRGLMDYGMVPTMKMPTMDGRVLEPSDCVPPPLFADIVKDLDVLKISAPIKTQQKSTTVFINDPSGTAVRFQLEEIDMQQDRAFKVPFGIKSFQNENTLRPNLHVNISDPALIACFQKLDEFILNKAISCCDTWFKRGTGPEDVPMMYRPMLNIDPTSTYAPFLNCKINLRPDCQDMFRCMTYNSVTNDITTIKPVNADTIQAGTRGYPIISIGGIWFMSGRFGLTLNIKDFLITSRQSGAGSLAFDFGASQPTFQAAGGIDRVAEMLNECIPDIQDGEDDEANSKRGVKRALEID
jgi:hypothetical protein